MKKGIAAALVAGMLVAAPMSAVRAGEGAAAYGEALKLMTDSLMKLMAGVFMLYSDATVPLWSSISGIFGEYGEWCTACHQPLSEIYQRMGKAFDPDVHKTLSEEQLKKALEAYLKQKAETAEAGASE